MKGAPWKLRPRSEEGVEHRLRIKLPETTHRLTPSTRDGGPRQLYVRKKDLELEDGAMDYTPGCRGCEALMIGLPAVTHNAACRMRVGQRLEKTEEGKKRLADVERRQEQDKEKKSKPAITGLPDPTESEVRASVALGRPEEESSKRSQSKEGGGSPKKAKTVQTEKRAGSSLDDLYHDEIGDVGPSVVSIGEPTGTSAAPSAASAGGAASGSAAPGSILSYDQFWSPAVPRDVQSLFHLSTVAEVDEELISDLKSLGAHDVTEVFSPPRFTDKCKSLRITPRLCNRP